MEDSREEDGRGVKRRTLGPFFKESRGSEEGLNSTSDYIKFSLLYIYLLTDDE